MLSIKSCIRPRFVSQLSSNGNIPPQKKIQLRTYNLCVRMSWHPCRGLMAYNLLCLTPDLILLSWQQGLQEQPFFWFIMLPGSSHIHSCVWSGKQWGLPYVSLLFSQNLSGTPDCIFSLLWTAPISGRGHLCVCCSYLSAPTCIFLPSVNALMWEDVSLLHPPLLPDTYYPSIPPLST